MASSYVIFNLKPEKTPSSRGQGMITRTHCNLVQSSDLTSKMRKFFFCVILEAFMQMEEMWREISLKNIFLNPR